MRRRKSFLFILRVTNYPGESAARYSYHQRARWVTLSRKVTVVDVYESMYAEINDEIAKTGENVNTVLDWWSCTPLRGR